MDAKPFKYVPINELSNVVEEKEKICSGYYIDINKQLDRLTESYDEKNFEQNPFYVVEHNTTEYLEYLKKKENLIKAPAVVEPYEDNAVNLEKVFENMSQEDITAIENILNNSLKGVAVNEENFDLGMQFPTKIDLNCLEEIEFESDSDSVVLVSKFPNHNCLELGVAKTLIQLHQK